MISMQTVRVAGRKYSDPDVISLVRATGSLIDPRSAVISQARRLTAKLKVFDSVPTDPIARMVVLASLTGIRVEQMDVSRQQSENRDAILLSATSGMIILYNPMRPIGRVAFSIGHEISHSFFPNSVAGSRFRNICDSGSKEANELERLCDLGASELLMPLDDFRMAVANNYTLVRLKGLAAHFGSSLEATAFRLATAHPGLAVAGLLRYRRRVGEERAARHHSQQRVLFNAEVSDPGTASPKYRRQSCYLSEACGDDLTIRWNKSFAPDSVVYKAASDRNAVHSSAEVLPNDSDIVGTLEAMCDPYQREDAHPEFPDVLFLWVACQ